MSESQKTIKDFGDQWTRYTDNDGYYGSQDLLSDITEPVVCVDEFKDAYALDIGSGTGRIVKMLLNAGARHVTAIEPSAAFQVLEQHLGCDRRVTLVNAGGEHIPDTEPYDIAVSIGVLHHVPNPAPIVSAVYRSLRPGGKFLIWVYGLEGNELYHSVFSVARMVTTRLPHIALVAVVWLLYALLQGYMRLARLIAVPLRAYVLNVIGRMAPDKQRLIIYDQLNPSFAKYYRRSEAEHLLTNAGFVNVTAYHRHGYSWTVVGTKPSNAATPNS